jgi:hypothetical protein
MILPVQHLYVFKVLRLLYLMSGNKPLANEYYATRSKIHQIFKTPKVVKSILRQSLNYVGPKYFNQLPKQIKESTTLKEFCLLLKIMVFLK